MSGKEYIFKGKLFSDCTGDGEVGFWQVRTFVWGGKVKRRQVNPGLL